MSPLRAYAPAMAIDGIRQCVKAQALHPEDALRLAALGAQLVNRAGGVEDVVEVGPPASTEDLDVDAAAAWWNDFRSWSLVAVGVLAVLCERWFA